MRSTDELVHAAVEARAQAYAPYSGYRVGAAMLDTDGRVWVGANVENISYGLTICAERVAASQLATQGNGDLAAVAVATSDGGTPCGMCLQTLVEFSPEPDNVTVHTVNEAGQIRTFTLRDLLPFAFHSTSVPRTERAPAEVVNNRENK